MTFYSEMRAVASELLQTFNQGAIVYVEVQPGNGPVDNPGEPTEVPHPVNGVVRGVSFKYVQKGLAVASDLQCTIEVSDDFTPDMRGFISMDGARKKIVAVINIPPSGETVAHRIIFKS